MIIGRGGLGQKNGTTDLSWSGQAREQPAKRNTIRAGGIPYEFVQGADRSNSFFLFFDLEKIHPFVLVS